MQCPLSQGSKTCHKACYSSSYYAAHLHVLVYTPKDHQSPAFSGSLYKGVMCMCTYVRTAPNKMLPCCKLPLGDDVMIMSSISLYDDYAAL